MTDFRLLAKSLPEGVSEPTPSMTLPGHLEDVCSAAEAVVESTGEEQLFAVKLAPEDYFERFKRVMTFAAAVHDIGKANDHFQAVVQPSRFPNRLRRGCPLRQGLRHEWLSVLLISDDQFGIGDWLRKAVNDDFDWRIVQWAVSGHHPSYGRPSPPRLHVDGGGSSMNVLIGHADFRSSLSWIGGRFGIGEPPEIKEEKLTLPLIGDNNAFARIFRWYRDSSQQWRPPEFPAQETIALVAATKACLIAADIAGSALPRGISDADTRSAWIRDGFDRIPSHEELSQVIASRLGVSTEEVPESLRQFQKDVGSTPGRVIVAKAGCGSGKTLAAYERARQQWPGRRLYFCYPTTGTATEGFRDYLVSDEQTAEAESLKDSGTPMFGARLFHSRQDVDFEILGIREPDADLDEAVEGALRVDSLEAWSTPIVSCTCDFVLGLVQNNRRGLYSWPALAGAAFVFDEIHAYDDRLFGALLRFLTEVRGVPILLMTASLPKRREMTLRHCLKQLGEDYVEIPGSEKLESLPRYHHETTDSDAVLERIAAEIEAGGKVLWVCNTVQRAIDAWDVAREAELSPILYHSRFRYEDRVQRHKEVIDAFDPKKTSGPALAICTQVAEMSLDLSATLLVSDLAPVPSIIQRLGRLNRRAKPPQEGQPPPPTMPFVIIEPLTDNGSLFHLPYSSEDMVLTTRWLTRLGESETAGLSQRDLATAWEAMDEVAERRPAYVSSAWFDGGPTTDVLELRDGSPGITVIRAADEEAVRSELKPLGRVTIPMPPPPMWIREQLLSAESRDRRIRGVFVVDNTLLDYSPERGGQWQRNEK